MLVALSASSSAFALCGLIYTVKISLSYEGEERYAPYAFVTVGFFFGWYALLFYQAHVCFVEFQRLVKRQQRSKKNDDCDAAPLVGYGALELEKDVADAKNDDGSAKKDGNKDITSSVRFRGDPHPRVDLHKLKRGGYDVREVDRVNTAVRNTLEQSLTFLPLLWTCACFAGDDVRGPFAGWVWLASRALYPFVCQKPPPLLFVSTLPGYCAQLYLALSVLTTYA